jgi:hypothetical protein
MINKEAALEAMRRRIVPYEECMDGYVLDEVLGFEPIPQRVLDVAADKPGVLYQAVEMAKVALTGTHSKDVKQNITKLAITAEKFKRDEQIANGYSCTATTAEIPLYSQRQSRSVSMPARSVSLGDRTGYAF